jgi:hypothetical protein
MSVGTISALYFSFSLAICFDSSYRFAEPANPSLERDAAGGLILGPGNVLLTRLAIAHILAIGAGVDTHASRLTTTWADQLHLRNWKGSLNLDTAGLTRATALDVLDNDIDAFDDDLVVVDHVDADRAALALVAAGDHFDLITAPNLSHRTSYLFSLARRTGLEHFRRE